MNTSVISGNNNKKTEDKKTAGSKYQRNKS